MRQSFSLHQHPKQFMLSPLQQLHSSAPQEASSSTRLWTYKTTYLYSGSLFPLTLLFIQRSGSGFDEMKPSIPCKFKARKSLVYLLLDCKLYKALPMIALLPLYSGPNWLSNFVQNFSLFGAELRTLLSEPGTRPWDPLIRPKSLNRCSIPLKVVQVAILKLYAWAWALILSNKKLVKRFGGVLISLWTTQWGIHVNIGVIILSEYVKHCKPMVTECFNHLFVWSVVTNFLIYQI